MNAGEKSAPARRRSKAGSLRQRGAALLIFLLLLVMAGLTYLVSGLSPESADARRTQQTQEVLSQARDALIGYAIQYRERQLATGTLDAMYGYLPMPDVGTSRFHASQTPACNTEGCAMSFINGAFPADTETIIGRFPWKTLGLEPLRDAHGECLWYIVSANHKDLGISSTVRMNWDTLSHLDIVVANSTAALTSALTSDHDRPVAVIFSPGPLLAGQNRVPSGGDDVARCGGNYDVANYLDPATAGALGIYSNYFGDPATPNDPNASAVTDTDTQKKNLSLQGKVFASGGNFLPNACQGVDCTLVANDNGLSLTGDALFGAIRKNANFRVDINSMLDRMTFCLRDKTALMPSSITGLVKPADKSSGRFPVLSNTCYDYTKSPIEPYQCITNSGMNMTGVSPESTSDCVSNRVDPKGYFSNYQEMVFFSKPDSGTLAVNGENCAGVLLFANQRGSTQQRVTATQKDTPSMYLEGDNLTHFVGVGTTFTGDILFDRLNRVPPQAAAQDITRCIPTGSSFTPVTSPALLPAQQLVAYDAATRVLTLGRQDVTTGFGFDADALFGCAWFNDSRLLGGGLRSYFKLQFRVVGTNVGFNGFVFALADGRRNNLLACGAGSSHLGYSGNNGVTPKINFPKLGVEFDQSRNAGYSEPADLSASTPGRNDPCLVSSCGAVPAYPASSHAAIVYWGHETANVTDGVARPDDDDNAHGFPTALSLPGVPRPPRSHADHAAESGIKPINLRGVNPATGNIENGYDSRLYHVRVEVTPTRNVNADPALSSTSLRTEAWIEWDPSLSNQLAAIKNTTRPMSLLYPAYAATLSDTAILYDVPDGDCSVTGCPACKTATNTCYWPALGRVQLGFTGSQRTSDQQVEISDFFTTWLP